MDIQNNSINSQWFPNELRLTGQPDSEKPTSLLEPSPDQASVQGDAPLKKPAFEAAQVPANNPSPGTCQVDTAAAAPGKVRTYLRNSVIGLLAGITLFGTLESLWMKAEPPSRSQGIEKVLENGAIAPLENHASEKDRGLILLQIDGLSYGTLKEAMDKGYAPNMKKMLDSGDYGFQKFFSGTPAETLPILSGAFYGVPIAANDWYDKEKGAMVDSIKEEPRIQKEAALKNEPGLLSDGTSYLSPLTGGSVDTAINVSYLYQARDQQGTIKPMSKEIWKEIKLIKRGHHSLCKMAYNFTRDFFKARSDLKASGQWNSWWDKHYPYLISMADNVFPTVATEGVKQSIDRGLPITYVDYTSYDESGHYYGAKTQKAMESITVVDKKIGEVLQKIEKEKKPYDVVVFSDHGQTESVLYSKLYGKSIQEMVIDWAQETNPSSPAKKGDIEIAHTYSSANVYFNFTKGRAGHDEIEQHYPGIVRKMIDHPSMDFVVYRTSDGIGIESKDGKITMDSKGIRTEGKDPLAKYGDSTFLTNLLAEYMEVPKTGDMLLFSAFHEGRIIDFNDKYSMVSLHGGLGGEQTEPFMIYGKDTELEPEKIKGPMDLYRQFKKLKEER